MSKKLLVIAAVAVMLVGATSAYGYYEDWDGWFNSGYITYGGNNYTSVGSNVVSDSTLLLLPQDNFYLKANASVDFVYDGGWYEDTLTLGISRFFGSKPTGDESGHKEGSGGWSGSARVHGPGHPDLYFTIWGTWDTDGANEYFDYRTCPCPPGDPPTYTADWDVTGSYPDGITGGGTCSGTRSSYLRD